MRRHEIPAHLQRRSVATAVALTAVTRSRLRGSDVQHPFRGAVLFAPAGPSSVAERCRAFLPLMRDGWAFSHRTAAELYSGALPGTPAPGRLDVAVVDPATPPRRAGVHGHKVVGMLVQELDGMPVASPGDVWVQLAAVLPEPVVSPPVEVLGGIVLHPDLGYVDHRIAIEYEGEHHRLDRRQWQHDLERQMLFEAAGWRLVRVTSAALFERPESLMRNLSHLLRR